MPPFRSGSFRRKGRFRWWAARSLTAAAPFTCWRKWRCSANCRLPLTGPRVRSALTAVIRRTLDAAGTFDRDGWLTVGFCGHQPHLGEAYISTGSLYLSAAALLPLGLRPEDVFWAGPAEDWTARRIWRGEDAPADHAI